jgi:hypothetical protein
MQLDVFIQDNKFTIDVSPEALEQGRPLFEKMDRDMDAGWRMGPEFVEDPNRVVRAQIAADRLLTALETDKEALSQAMAAYILARVPEARSVTIDTDGEPLNTSLQDASGAEILA